MMKYAVLPMLALAIIISTPASADDGLHDNACATVASQIGFYTAALAALKESAMRAETVAELVINHRYREARHRLDGRDLKRHLKASEKVNAVIGPLSNLIAVRDGIGCPK